MRAIVTGGAGFIGSNLVDTLIAWGDEITVIDNLSTGTRDDLNPAAAFAELDVRDGFDAAGADVIYHLAAQTDVQTSMREPIRDALKNVVGTIAVLEAARDAGAKVVFASTGGAIYGECHSPAGEHSPLRPTSPYGIGKLCAEEYVRGWNRIHGAGHTILRFGNVYGPRQQASLEGGVVAIFLERMAHGDETVIFGDGQQTRDFVYVADVVEALLAAASHDGGTFNIGTGVPTSVLTLHYLCADAAGVKSDPRFMPERSGDVRHSVLDVTAAADQLGWRRRTPFTEGLSATWRSMQDRAALLV